MWSLGLRGSQTPRLEDGGLREVRLCFNRFGAEFSKTLIKFLQYDRYVRVLDVSHNELIDFAGIVGALRNNESLVTFDARFNPGYSAKAHRAIALRLLRNIDSLSAVRIPIQRSWIRKDVLEIRDVGQIEGVNDGAIDEALPT